MKEIIITIGRWLGNSTGLIDTNNDYECYRVGVNGITILAILVGILFLILIYSTFSKNERKRSS